MMATERSAGSAAGPSLEGTGGTRVLLLEDQPADAKLIAAHLRRASPDVQLINEETLTGALSHDAAEFEVILTDLNLPDSSGVDTVTRLAARFPAIPIIAMTTDLQRGVECIRSGAQDFIPKSDLRGPMLARAILFSIERKQSTMEATRESTRDSLTDLLNRRTLERLADGMLSGATGDSRGVFAVFVDVNDLKGINDRHGHAIGDDVLRCMARTLASSVRAEDLVGRLGGDEFVVVGRADAEYIATLVSRLRTQLSRACVIGADPPEDQDPDRPSAAVGAAYTQEPSQTIAALIDQADRAMYRDKTATRIPRARMKPTSAGPAKNWSQTC